MKKSIYVSSLTLSLFFIISSGFTQASDGPFSNKYDLIVISKEYSGPLFQLKLNNALADKFIITIRDGEGEVLHKESITGKDLSRKYKLAFSTEREYESFYVSFEILNATTLQKSIYEINNVESLVTNKSARRLR